MSTLSDIEFDYLAVDEIPQALATEQEGMLLWSCPSQKLTILTKDILPTKLPRKIVSSIFSPS